MLEKLRPDQFDASQTLYFQAVSCTVIIRMGDMKIAMPFCETTDQMLQSNAGNVISRVIGHNSMGYYYSRHGIMRRRLRVMLSLGASLPRTG